MVPCVCVILSEADQPKIVIQYASHVCTPPVMATEHNSSLENNLEYVIHPL